MIPDVHGKLRIQFRRSGVRLNGRASDSEKRSSETAWPNEYC